MTAALDVGDEILLSPDELAVALAEHERRAAVLALAVSHVSGAGSWSETGAVSMRAWLRDTCRMSDRDAGAWLRRARLLDSYTEFADAAIDGTLGSSHLAALERLHTARYAELLAEHQTLLVRELAPCRPPMRVTPAHCGPNAPTPSASRANRPRSRCGHCTMSPPMMDPVSDGMCSTTSPTPNG